MALFCTVFGIHDFEKYCDLIRVRVLKVIETGTIRIPISVQ